ncbi:MAG: hypothetical protein ACE5FT_06555 [Candidatus Nanoarchaeia archaeon]
MGLVHTANVMFGKITYTHHKEFKKKGQSMDRIFTYTFDMPHDEILAGEEITLRAKGEAEFISNNWPMSLAGTSIFKFHGTNLQDRIKINMDKPTGEITEVFTAPQCHHKIDGFESVFSIL